MRKTWLTKSPVLLTLLAACGAGGAGSSAAPDAGHGSNMCFSSNECPTGWTCSEFGTCQPPVAPTPDGGVPPPPPPEVERDIGQPSSTLRYVYVAMSALDELAKIDGSSLAVTAITVGDRPGIVAGIPGGDDAVVLDRGSATATIVRPTTDHDQKITLAMLPHMNSMVVDPTGHFALAYFDLVKAVSDAGSLGGVGEIGSFQDVTVLSLAPGNERADDLSVGFRPRKVEFDEAGTHAYVITEDGISVIDLAQAAAGTLHVAATIPIAAPSIDSALLEVNVTPDGAYAVVRQLGVAQLRLVALSGALAGASFTIPLPSEATDVDLAGGRAFAVLRGTSQLAVVDLPADAFDPSGVDLVDLDGAIAGQAVIDADVHRAILFTNAENVESVTVVDLTQPGFPHDVIPLQKGVRTLGFAPDGRTALILHNKLPGDPAMATNVDDVVDLSYGYSLVDMETGFAKLQITPVDPGAFAFAPDSSHAYLALDGGDAEGAVMRLQTLDLSTFVVTSLQLGSPPEAVGILPNAGVVYVSQRHPLGRMTFVSLVNGSTHTVTGFQLNSQIVD